MTIEITRRIEFDAGHRIPYHKSKCRNIHGHRYVVEATVAGLVKEERGASDNGMVMDFGDLKDVMVEVLHDIWDHAFLVWEDDEKMIAALTMMDVGHKTVLLPCVPTVENLVRLAFSQIDTVLRLRRVAFRLVRVKMWETPNCYAVHTP